MDTRGKNIKIALAIYTPPEYKKLLARAVDASNLDKTWEEWLNSVEGARINFTAMGYQCIGVAIQIDALENFCQERGLENNGEARAEYASFLLQQQEQITQLAQKTKAPKKR